jgi:hypothetical protein
MRVYRQGANILLEKLCCWRSEAKGKDGRDLWARPETELESSSP